MPVSDKAVEAAAKILGERPLSLVWGPASLAARTRAALEAAHKVEGEGALRELLSWVKGMEDAARTEAQRSTEPESMNMAYGERRAYQFIAERIQHVLSRSQLNEEADSDA